MKKITLIAATALIVCCQKKENVLPSPDPANASQNSTVTTLARNADDPIKYFLNGDLQDTVDIDTFDETDSTTYLGMDSSTIFVFRGNSSLLSWTQLNATDPTSLQAFKGEVSHMMADIKAFHDAANAQSIDDNDDEALQVLFNQMFPAAKIEGSFTVWCNRNYDWNGGYDFGVRAWPNMANGNGMDNCVSSFMGHNIRLCDKAWFKGTNMIWWAGNWSGNGGWFMEDKTSSIFWF